MRSHLCPKMEEQLLHLAGDVGARHSVISSSSSLVIWLWCRCPPPRYIRLEMSTMQSTILPLNLHHHPLLPLAFYYNG